MPTAPSGACRTQALKNVLCLLQKSSDGSGSREEVTTLKELGLEESGDVW